ncbi:CDGSH iron-sulfur domain-containing protein 3, mitochondrial [Anthonomus grandis grandis]|uniref:CDGSH iron-sulfur domain-containing protein 3, mitochondrial n=1 Tax=Anthonomus grandis grandis TaxID=2921223 RepID=UPI00216577B1|nr:CDGSH iron-sulfur domain-containing protein 3, mitochondrial [Anthonomus grandis grandis]
MALKLSNLMLKNRTWHLSSINMSFSSKPTPEIPKNKLEPLISAHTQQENGVVYDKKPFRMLLEAGKKYSWCLCGRSHKQPLCDGTHRGEQLKIKQKPIRFMVEETKEYWLCNCKQTNNRPFCDGSHKSQRVQDATSIVRQ